MHLRHSLILAFNSYRQRYSVVRVIQNIPTLKYEYFFGVTLVVAYIDFPEVREPYLMTTFVNEDGVVGDFVGGGGV